MSYIDTLLARNEAFAHEQAAANTLMPSLPEQLPHVKALIVGCADMRVDPAQLLQLQPGEAVVMRNIGGRVTPGLLQQLGLLGRIGDVSQATPGGDGEFHIVVLHHTDCGITRLADDHDLLAGYFKIDTLDLAEKAVADPNLAVAADVATLRAVLALPAQWLISGQVYDVATGTVRVIVPAAPLRAC